MLLNQFSKKIGFYFKSLITSYQNSSSIVGFFLMLVLINQLLTGLILIVGFISEIMINPGSRELEDLHSLYNDDFLWVHEKGVDLFFFLIYFHILRKLYLICFDKEQEQGWKSGVILFFILQVIAFTGITLSCTHLSEITVNIALNFFHSCFYFKGQFYTVIFTSKSLNTDTLERLMFLHMTSPFALLILSIQHSFDIHYDWKSEQKDGSLNQKLNWFDEVSLSEITRFLEFIFLIFFGSLIFAEKNESISYEFFGWGDVGFITDIRYLSVAPHWYFRPFMGWLLICPYHYLGFLGLLFLFFSLYFQNTIFNSSDELIQKNLQSLDFFLKNSIFKNYIIIKLEKVNIITSFQWNLSYVAFIVSIYCTFSCLPYGRFYNRVYGRFDLLFSYMYIYLYLGTRFIRYSYFLNSIKFNFFKIK